MDGVLYRGKQLIPGADKFIAKLQESRFKYLFLTNNTSYTAEDLKDKLQTMGIHGLSENDFMTSGMATAMFLKDQKPNASVYAIGDPGLMKELEDAGLSFSDSNVDYVVVGKTTNFNFEMMKTATRLIIAGAKFIGTNPDVIDPMEDGMEPACGAILAAIKTATGKKPFIVGKPNALMMTLATQKLGVHADDTMMIGDRMDTDIIAGLETGMTTCLVLSGVTNKADLNEFAYSADYIFDSVADIDLSMLNKA